MSNKQISQLKVNDNIRVVNIKHRYYHLTRHLLDPNGKVYRALDDEVGLVAYGKVQNVTPDEITIELDLNQYRYFARLAALVPKFTTKYSTTTLSFKNVDKILTADDNFRYEVCQPNTAPV